MYENSNQSTFLPVFSIVCFLKILVILMVVQCYLITVLIYISPMTTEIEQLNIYLLPIAYHPVKFLFESFCPFFHWVVFFFFFVPIDLY